MATPTLKFQAPTVPEDELFLKPEPVVIYGMESGGGEVESVNGQTGAVVLNASDVGAVSTVNGQSGAVTLTASDVNAKPSSYAPAVADVTGLQSIIDDLTQRIEALESAAG